MATPRQIEKAAMAIHRFEQEQGYVAGEWGGTLVESNYMEMAKQALEAAEIECARLQDRLDSIAAIAEGSGTVNSLPHIAKIARGDR